MDVDTDIGEIAEDNRWNDLLSVHRIDYTVRGRAMRAAHRALLLRTSGRNVDESAIHLQRYNLLNAPHDAWRRQRAMMRRLRIENPKATLFITVTAWTISCLVCVCVLFLLSRDYIRDRNSALFSSRLEFRAEQPLPAITFCQSLENLPAFPLFGSADETAWPGEPLFRLRTLLRDSGDLFLEEDPDIDIDPFYVGPVDGHCIEELSVLETRNLVFTGGGSFAYGTDRESCKACFQIGRRKALTLRQTRNSKPTKDGSRFYRVRAESSAAALACAEYPKVCFTPLLFYQVPLLYFQVPL